MSTITDMLAAARATYLPVGLVPKPTEPFGYGSDLSCVSDFTDNFDEVDPNSREGLTEYVFRLLTADKDSIPDAPGRGYNLRKLLHKGMTRAEIRAQEGFVRGEVVQDDRFDGVRVEMSIDVTKRDVPVRVRLFLTPADPKIKPFDFVFAIKDDGEAMLEALAT